MKRLTSAALCMLSFAPPAAILARAESPVAALTRFSDFDQIDLNRLWDSEILTQRSSLMNFPNGNSGQTCFVVPPPAEDTAKRLQVWDPSPYADLKVYAFYSLQAPCSLADFEALDSKSVQRPVRWLMDKTVATTAAKSSLNLTRDEAKTLAACTAQRSDPQKVAQCWAKLLFERASQFQQKGLAGTWSDEMSDSPASPAAQRRAMLLEQLQITREFATLLKQVGLLGNQPAASLIPFDYWTLLEAEHHATVVLCAVYQLAVGDHYQLADVQHYLSNDYYTSVTSHEVWPIQVGPQRGAQVWRGDFFAAPMLEFTKGTERIASGALMLQDIKKEAPCFQDALKLKR